MSGGQSPIGQVHRRGGARAEFSDHSAAGSSLERGRPVPLGATILDAATLPSRSLARGSDMWLRWTISGVSHNLVPIRPFGENGRHAGKAQKFGEMMHNLRNIIPMAGLALGCAFG